MNCPAVPRATATEILPAADMPAPSAVSGPNTVTATAPVPGDLELLDRPATPQRTPGREAEPARRRGPRDCGNSVDINDRGVVTDRDSSPTGGSIASPGRSPRASPCLTCLDTENALRPGNTPDPGEISCAMHLL